MFEFGEQPGLDGGEIAELGPVIDVFTRPQQAITRSLIDEIVPQQLPESVAVRVNALAAQLAQKHRPTYTAIKRSLLALRWQKWLA